MLGGSELDEQWNQHGLLARRAQCQVAGAELTLM
jgi:hypothetical protein